jgi:prepilin-type N-terminal cleavage/methylation domain-containing protein
MKARQSGFTLVEIAIVLVIIGLLLGGILKGQEMITQAKIKNVINDFNGMSAAMYSYQDRYRAIPGDDAAATRWGAAVIPGDGNRILAGAYNAADVAVPVALTPETILWWDHLRRSGFVTGASGGTKPVNSFGGFLGVQTGNGATPPIAALPAATGFTNLIMCSQNLPDKVAIALPRAASDWARMGRPPARFAAY